MCKGKKEGRIEGRSFMRDVSCVRKNGVINVAVST